MSDATTEIEVDCPGCGLRVVGTAPKASAEWFCPRCDYPLFWAQEAEPDPQPLSRAARRRLPGTGGRTQVGAEPCWHCGEMIDAGATECPRCAAVHPKPMAPTVEVIHRVAVPTPVVARLATWPFVTGGVLAGISIGIVLTLWWGGVA